VQNGDGCGISSWAQQASLDQVSNTVPSPLASPIRPLAVAPTDTAGAPERSAGIGLREAPAGPLGLRPGRRRGARDGPRRAADGRRCIVEGRSRRRGGVSRAAYNSHGSGARRAGVVIAPSGGLPYGG